MQLPSLIDNPHLLAFYIFVGIGVIVFGVLMASLLKFRQSNPSVKRNFHQYIGIEIFWTVIPFVLLVVMTIPASTVLIKKSYFNSFSTPIREVDNSRYNVAPIG